MVISDASTLLQDIGRPFDNYLSEATKYFHAFKSQLGAFGKRRKEASEHNDTITILFAIIFANPQCSITAQDTVSFVLFINYEQ